MKLVKDILILERMATKFSFLRLVIGIGIRGNYIQKGWCLDMAFYM